jgi:endonuclease YncB( thermonuclease family)
LRGINAPEINSKDPVERARAVEAKAFLDGWLTGKKLVIRTHKDANDKYGRLMVDRGLAVEYDAPPQAPSP